MKKWSFIIVSSYTNYLRNHVNDLFLDDIYFYSTGSDEDADLRYFFSSSHLNHLETPTDVYEYGLHLKSLFDGLSFIVHQDKNDYHPIKLGALINNTTNETHNLNYSQPLKNFNVQFQKFKSNLPKVERGFEKTLFMATQDEFILNLLIIFSDGIDFKSMYQALDEIKRFLSKKKDSLQNLGFSDAIIKRFTHTANSFPVLGKKARHGSDNNEPPKSPMELKDAQKLLSDIVYTILLKHYKIDLPIYKAFKVDLDDIKWDWDSVDF